jgi:uncharacterized phiE125 gp8 family phage protein
MLPRKITVPPAEEPLTLAQAKRWCRITTDEEDQDVLDFLAGARRFVERETELALITQTVEVKLDGFWCGKLPLPMPPLQSVESVKYVDTDGAEQTLDPAVYRVSTHERPGTVWLATDQSWPATKDEREVVTITFKAGFGDTPADVLAAAPNLIHALRMICGQYDRLREAVVDGTLTEVPLGVRSLLASERIPEVAA